jgi:hypothetical protein
MWLVPVAGRNVHSSLTRRNLAVAAWHAGQKKKDQAQYEKYNFHSIANIETNVEKRSPATMLQTPVKSTLPILPLFVFTG